MQSNREAVPTVNDFVDDKYLRLFSEPDQGVFSTLYTFSIIAHRMRDRHFTKTEFYDHFRAQNSCEWYFKMTRILYMGGISGTKWTMIGLEIAYFSDPNHFCQHLGAHVFINMIGALASVLCYNYSHFNQAFHFQATSYATINAVMPKYRQYTHFLNSVTPLFSLQIATRMQIVNIADGNRDTGRHGSTQTGGVFYLNDRAIARNRFETYRQNDDMVLPFFGIYVCKNSKLLVIDPCRVEACAQADPVCVHHSRTLYQSGSFLIIEGLYCFRFARYGRYIFSERDLEDYAIIERYVITGKLNPIFFLRPVVECDTIAWCLSPAEELRHTEQWVLTIPDGGQFEAIEEYYTGVYQVMHLQSRLPSPWSDNVEKPGYTVSHDFSLFQIPAEDEQRLNYRLNLLQNNRNEVWIDWTRIGNREPPRDEPQFIAITPLYVPITDTNRVLVKLLLGTPLGIPYEYRFRLEWFSRVLSQPHFFGMIVNRYYVINKFWYRRVSDDNHHPLIVQYVPHTELPDHLYNVWPYVIGECPYYRMFGYIAHPANEPHVDIIECVVVLYWESPLRYVVQ